MYIVYINGKKFTEEQDRSLFPGVWRVAGECPEHPHKVLMGIRPPCQRVERCVIAVQRVDKALALLPFVASVTAMMDTRATAYSTVMIGISAL